MLFYSNFHSCFQIPPLASGRSSDSSGLSDSTFLILLLFSTEECCSLSFSLTLSVHMSSSSILSSCFPDFQGIFLDKDILETTIRFKSFPGFPDYQDATYQLIIFSIGQWTTSLPRFASFLSFGSFGSLLLIVLLWGKVYHFMAMPFGLATSLSGFTSLVKEVRKVGFEVGHLSAHVTTNWLIRANSCQRLIYQLY